MVGNKFNETTTKMWWQIQKKSNKIGLHIENAHEIVSYI
jgi:hypothetical protein